MSIKRFIYLPIFIYLPLLLTLMMSSSSVFATINVYQFDNEAQEERYRTLVNNFRCPKCQNQNLANSDSGIATDLKRKTYEQIKAGKSDAQIRQYMIERYGDFISYQPPVRPATYVLWYLPPILLLLAIVGWPLYYRIKHRQLSDHQQNLSLSNKSNGKANELTDKKLTNIQLKSNQLTNNPSTTVTKLNRHHRLTSSSIILGLSVVVISIGLYFSLANRQAVWQYWHTEQRFVSIADDLLTGKINQPPKWAIETPENIQTLVSCMQKNVHHHANDEKRWLRLADVFLSIDSTDSAVQAMERANRLAPDNAEIATTYAKVVYSTNGGILTTKAKKALQRILANDPSNQRASMLLIMHATNQGNPQQALLWANKLKSAIEHQSGGHSKQIASLERLINTIKHNQSQR